MGIRGAITRSSRDLRLECGDLRIFLIESSLHFVAGDEHRLDFPLSSREHGVETRGIRAARIGLGRGCLQLLLHPLDGPIALG